MRRPVSSSSFGTTLLVVNVIFIVINLIVMSRNTTSRIASTATSGKKPTGDASATDGGDPFMRSLMEEKVKLQSRVQELREELAHVKSGSADGAPARVSSAGPKLVACRTAKATLEERIQGADRDVLQLKDALKRCQDSTLAPQATDEEDSDNKAVVPSGPASGKDEAFLIIGIPTVPRKRETKSTKLEKLLLYRTLESMRKQIEGAFGGDDAAHGVKVVVMNMRPGAHSAFDRVKAHFGEAAKWVEFLENSDPLEDDKDKQWAPEFAGSTKEQPTDPVRRQTLDVIALLRAAAGRSRYYFFTEDDFAFCDNTLMALRYMIQRANEYQGVGQWTAIRCSFGLNGILMHNVPFASQKKRKAHPKGDLDAFASYMERHFNRRPPDHLVVEWFAKESKEASSYFGEKRHVMAFRYNVVLHLGGRASTLRSEEAWSFPGCFTELIAPQVFVVEAWNPIDCPEDDIWPCDYGDDRVRPATLVWNNSSAAHVSNDRIVYVDEGRPKTAKRRKH